MVVADKPGKRGSLALQGALLAGTALLAIGTSWFVYMRFRSHRLWWYSLVYCPFYVARLRIWERRVPPSDLIELVEGAQPLAPGRALDLGCGTGTDSIFLAQHGWDVTGVDMVPEALALASKNAAAAGVKGTFVQGDVTRLHDVVHGTFDLLLDFGCFHTLPPELRPLYVDSVSAVAALGATFLLYGFARPPRLAPMQAGVSFGRSARPVQSRLADRERRADLSRGDPGCAHIR
jgi:SAM-dependent methyltransferase